MNYSQANCSGLNPDLFFPQQVPGKRMSIQVEEAKAVCQGCVVRELCLEENLHEQFGIWAGTTPRERRAIRARRKLEPPPKPENPKKQQAHYLRSNGYSVSEVAQALDISEWWVSKLTKEHTYPRVVKPKDRDYCWRCDSEREASEDGLCKLCADYRRKYPAKFADAQYAGVVWKRAWRRMNQRDEQASA